MPHAGPSCASARPLGVRAVKSTFSPSASRPSGASIRVDDLAQHVARGRVARVERDGRAVGIAHAELGRQALRVPRLPPEQDVLAARVPLRDPAAEVGPLRGVRLVRRRTSPATCRRGRPCPGTRPCSLEVREEARRSAPASRSRARGRRSTRREVALRAPAAEDRLAPPRRRSRGSRRRRGAARDEVVAVRGGAPRTGRRRSGVSDERRRLELAVDARVPLVVEPQREAAVAAARSASSTKRELVDRARRRRASSHVVARRRRARGRAAPA